MTFETYHLAFDAPAHFGLEGIGQERIEQTVRSDTLWAALIQKWLLLYDDDPDQLCQAPPFAVSSCFPVIDNCQFFPLPVGAFDDLVKKAAAENTEHSEGFSVKGLQKVRYLSQELFFRYIGGEGLTLDNLKKGATHFPRAFRDGAAALATEFAEEGQRPRIRTDQLSAGVWADAFFYCADQYFAAQSGLFFLASFDKDGIRKRFEAALRLLGDTGLGADRSVGRGTFTFTAQRIQFPTVKKPHAYVLLSLYHPTRTEVEGGILKKAKYSLARRYGHAGAPGVGRFRRADVWMLAEGSVLGPEAGPPDGDIPVVIARSGDVPHNVYRYGRAFLLPMVPPRKR